MPNQTTQNPAEEAAQRATETMYSCIDDKRSFILEAGAGAGKTYSLINALEHLLAARGTELIRTNKKIACITFTNVAKEQIESRTDKHPAIHTDTVHAFCWSLIRNFQPELLRTIPAVGKWAERIAEAGGIDSHLVNYDFGYPSIESGVVSLHHDDVISLTVELLKNEKFRRLFISKYPILFIDEYQDTDIKFAEAIQTHFLTEGSPLLVGLFGDHWQKIYGAGCGYVSNSHLQLIEKNSNFRSSPTIIEVLNRIRPELQQFAEDPEKEGSATVYHTNTWGGERLTKNHWQGDLPDDVAHTYLETLMNTLTTSAGWDFSPEKTKILMLTHKVLANEQGYRNLVDVFPYNESFIKKEDKFIEFFADTLEPVCIAYSKKEFGVMTKFLNKKKPSIKSIATKLQLVSEMDALLQIRQTGTVADVLEFLEGAAVLFLPPTLTKRLKEMHEAELDNDLETASTTRLRNLLKVPFCEVTALTKFINNHTPFATKHSVKGDEFENVLVVFGRGWNLYDFNEMLTWEATGVPDDKQERYERGRNLFYVACSRPKIRLALLFTQQLSDEALQTLNDWFSNQVEAL